jgi:hypothetical protein
VNRRRCRRPAAQSSSKQPRGTLFKVDFATFLQASEFENRLPQTAAADAIELLLLSAGHRLRRHMGRGAAGPHAD